MEKLNSLFPFILYLLDSDFSQLKKKSVLQDGFFSPYCEDSQFSLLENFSGLGYFFNWVKSLFPLEEEDLQRILVEKIKWSLTERSSSEKQDSFKRPSRALLALKNEKRVVLLKKTPAWILCGENN